MASSSAGFNGGGLSDLGNRTLLQLRELASRLGLGGYSQPLISESRVHPHPAADVFPEVLKAHRSTLQLVSWPCRPEDRKLKPYLEKVVPLGLAPTRS